MFESTSKSTSLAERPLSELLDNDFQEKLKARRQSAKGQGSAAVFESTSRPTSITDARNDLDALYLELANAQRNATQPHVETSHKPDLVDKVISVCSFEQYL